MQLKQKIVMSMIVLHLALSIISIIWIISVTFTLIPQTQSSVQDLSVKILNETLQFETRALFQTTKINQTLQFNSPFFIRNILLNSFTNNSLENVNQDQIQRLKTFLIPLHKHHSLDCTVVLCNDDNIMQFGDSNQTKNEQINWTSMNQAKIVITNEQIRLIIGDGKCNIQAHLNLIDFVQNFLINANFNLNQVQYRILLLDANPFDIIWEQNGYNNISNIMNLNDLESLKILQLPQMVDKFNCLMQEPQTLNYNSLTEQRLIKYIQFSVNDQNYYCEQSKIIKLTYLMIISLNQFHEHLGTQNLNYNRLYNLNLATIVIIILLSLYFYRVAVKVALSFEVPLKIIISFINEPYKFHYENLQQRIYLKKQLHNNELLLLYDSLLLCVLMYQFHYKQQFLHDKDQGAEYLQSLCQLKQFYKFCQNKWMMSVCSNNTAMIHYKNKRYAEALNQLAESIMIGNKELTSLKQIEKLRKKMENNKLAKSMLNRLQSYIINKFAGKSSNIIDQGKFKSQEDQNRVCLSMSIHKSMAIRNSIEDKIQAYSIAQQQSLEYRKNYKKDKDQLTLCLFFRKYIYINILFKFCINTNSKLFNETINNIIQLNDDICSIQKWKKSKQLTVMRFKSQVKLFRCYIHLNMHLQAKLTHDNLKIIYDYFLGLQDDQIEYQIGFNVFRYIPISYFENQLKMQYIILLLNSQDNVRIAQESILLLSTLDQKQQKTFSFLFNIITKVFKDYQLNLSILNQIKFQFQQKTQKIVILLDYSKNMAFDQITQSQSYIKYILEKVPTSTSIGLYLFNETIFKIFSLKKKQYYSDLYSQILDRQFFPIGGNSKILEAIKFGIRQFTQNESQYSENFICLFSEFQSQPSNSDTEQLAFSYQEIVDQLQINNVKIIVFQIQNSNRNIENAELFCRGCKGLLFQNEQAINDWLNTFHSEQDLHRYYFEFW